jgi:hypothetical protein
MADILRDSALGQLLRLVNRKWLPYPDERPNFHLPNYDTPIDQEKRKAAEQTSSTDNDEVLHSLERQTGYYHQQGSDLEALRLAKTVTDEHGHTSTERTLSRALNPVRTADGIILIDWYTTGMSVSEILSCES